MKNLTTIYKKISELIQKKVGQNPASIQMQNARSDMEEKKKDIQKLERVLKIKIAISLFRVS